MKLSGHINDLTGKTFGYWTVLGYARSDERKSSIWLCQCKCGTIKEVHRRSLTSGSSKSCGCYVKEMDRGGEKNNNYRHGACKDRLYYIYSDMRDRCTNKNCTNYSYYGGRGIKLCDEWAAKKTGRIAFFEWAKKNGYEDGLTIDRKDVNGDYSPDNCQWVDKGFQAFNQRKRKSKLGIRGVYYRQQTGRYLVTIEENGNQHHIGCYKNLDDAIEARRNAELKYFGKIMDL